MSEKLPILYDHRHLEEVLENVSKDYFEKVVGKASNYLVESAKAAVEKEAHQRQLRIAFMYTLLIRELAKWAEETEDFTPRSVLTGLGKAIQDHADHRRAQLKLKPKKK